MKELSPRAQELVRAARHADDPTPADQDRVRKGLARTLAAGVVVGALAGAGKGAMAGVSLKIVVATAVTVAAVGGAITTGVVIHRRAPPPVVTRSIAEPPPRLPARKVIPAPIPSLPAATQPASGPVAAEPVAKQRPARVTHRRPRLSGATLEAETRELRQVQAALRAGRPDEALALLKEQAARYPRGELLQERSAARILALCALKRKREALASLARFQRSYPRSPLLARVQAACADLGPDPATAKPQ
jgi:hypothetical protein